MKRLPTVLLICLAVIGGTLVLDVAAYAATGKSLLLGKVNKSPRTTTLVTRGNGPALSLRTKAKAPPLAVTSRTRVPRLNADLVDGREAASLTNDTRRYTFTTATPQFSGSLHVVPDVPRGSYLVTLRTSLLPDGGAPNAVTNAQCVVRADGKDYAGDMTAYSGAFAALISGADVIRLGAPTDLEVRCNTTAGSFTFYDPLVLTLTTTNLVADLPLVPSP